MGDSISHNANFSKIEEETKSRLKTVKAYSSTKDNRARWPQKNLTDVTKAALKNTHENDEFDHLVIGAPSVDITNINTSKLSVDDSIEVFKQDVVTSCHNIFAVAQNAVQNHPNLKKVVIMQHAPRFDEQNVDPTGLKPKLAKMANSTFSQLWHSSVHKDKIIIGQHSLDCTSDLVTARYKDERTNRYDGVHMYGSFGYRAFTRSVVQILKGALPVQSSPADTSSSSESFHATCPQTVYQRTKTTNTGNSKKNNCHSPTYYSVPVNNRFDILEN